MTNGYLFLHTAKYVFDRKTVPVFQDWQRQEAFDPHIAGSSCQNILRKAVKLKITDRIGDIISVSGMTELEMPSLDRH